MRSEQEKNKLLAKLPPMIRIAYRMTELLGEELLTGKCDEDEVAETLAEIHPESKGYKDPNNYVTIDKGMKMLKMGQNRTKFCRMMKENNIENETFNTVHIGYSKRKIMALMHKKKGEEK